MSSIIIHGDPINGFVCVGPFEGWEACQSYANTEHGQEHLLPDWWVADLVRPEPDLERYQMQWVDTHENRVLDFDECAQLKLDGTLREVNP